MCDIATCGREVREPETTHTVTLSMVQHGTEDVVMDVHNGAQFEICDTCLGLPAAEFLCMAGVSNYLPGTLEFSPAENGMAISTIPYAGSVLTVIGDLDPEDEEEVTETATGKTILCPFCAYGPKPPYSIGVHMAHKHKGTKGYEQARQNIFPSVAAKADKEKAKKKRQRGLTNVQYMTDDMAREVG